ncbi:MAG: PilZ domain-containing protein [Nitrospirota bacterium]
METGKRKYSRCDFSQIVEYAFPAQATGNASTGLLHDFSCSGLCMITHHPLEAGQEIVIKSLVTSDSRKAVVRWCNNLGTTYKIGLEFRE